MWRYEGAKVMSKLHQLVLSVWREESTPEKWRDASITPIFMKGSQRDCGNYRGISLPNRVTIQIAPVVLPESQCGFRSGRGTKDIIFCLRQTHE